MKKTTPILSVLICTLPERKTTFERIKKALEHPEVEILDDPAEHQTVGEKRNNLKDRAAGDYICYVDDDDMISREVYLRIIEALKRAPDCVGIEGVIYQRGIERKWVVSLEYDRWFEKNGVYYRTPNHLAPVKRSIADKVKFPYVNHGEDAAYSKAIYPFLNREIFVSGCYYFYQPSGGKRK